MTDSKIPIRTFHFEVNALYAKDALAKQGIQCAIEQIDENHFELLCDSIKKNDASKELDILNLDESPVHKNSEGYLEEIDEWSTHMYNPIYWLERKKNPHFYYSKSMKLILGILFLVPGLAVFIIAAENGFETIQQNTAVTIISIFFGLLLVVQALRKNKTNS